MNCCVTKQRGNIIKDKISDIRDDDDDDDESDNDDDDDDDDSDDNIINSNSGSNFI